MVYCCKEISQLIIDMNWRIEYNYKTTNILNPFFEKKIGDKPIDNRNRHLEVHRPYPKFMLILKETQYMDRTMTDYLLMKYCPFCGEVTKFRMYDKEDGHLIDWEKDKIKAYAIIMGYKPEDTEGLI
jgi:hypothetical protein